jgi:NADPH:quinone reductase-like Zn-dependent oxidoreductase
VDVATAGAAALAGISAMLSIDALAPSEGARLLVIGATGGVGSIAVQLAARAGATVIAPALPDDADYLRGLGVAELIERGSDVAAAVRGVDGVLDLVSYSHDEFEANAAALSNGGRAASTIGAAGDAPGRTNIMAVGTSANLERLAGLLESGVRVPIHASYDLDRAGAALEQSLPHQ